MDSFFKSRGELILYISSQLPDLVGEDDGQVIAGFLIDDLFGRKKEYNLQRQDFDVLQKAVERLKNEEPLQYVTNTAYFLEYRFFVDSSVLIPRPETEEMVATYHPLLKIHNCTSVLDVGTGSGCIAISLSKLLPGVNVLALDLSKAALDICKTNAIELNAKVELVEQDFTKKELWNLIPFCDSIFSNPPYIDPIEKINMLPHVLDYEPEMALFPIGHVDTFYRLLEEFARLRALKLVVCELNADRSKEIESIFTVTNHWQTQVYLDLQNRARFLVALPR